MRDFSRATRTWFQSALGEPTAVQRRGWPAISAGHHTLLIAPTGSGKTLAAFLWCIDRLIEAPVDTPGVRVLYVSPLKALVYDVERNLRVPLLGIGSALEAAQRLPRVAIRTGDTSSKERREQLRAPAEILVTTPESLYLLLGSQAREHLRSVTTVVIDEVHAIAPTKRGAHLALSLERLARLTARDPQRIGLSATAHPKQEVARFLGGDRPVTIVDTSERPRLDVQIVVPVPDMTRPEEGVAASGAPEAGAGGGAEKGLWPAIYPRLLELIRGHRTTILFVNSRGLCERLTQRLNDLAGAELVRSHHGSLSHVERAVIEDQLKGGQIAGIVATSSLELGIDMGAVELVVLVESPGSVARGLQRVGRAGHRVGEVSKGRIFPKHRGDLLEAAVVSERMIAGTMEALHVPENPLDVLAQQIVAMVATEPWSVADLLATVQRSANYCRLPQSALHATLDMLSGRYPSQQFADLRPSVIWDREHDQLTTRRGAKLLALVNGGTIPDRGLFAVYLGADGPRVGELDEEMVHETVPGQVFTLGATSWRVERITRDRVIVSPAPGETGKLPFWRGEGPGRPVELGVAIGVFLRELTAMAPGQVGAWLRERHRLDDLAAGNLLAYVEEQRAATGAVPTDRAVIIERFRDELGDWRMCILSLFGARVHAPWALCLEAKLSARTGLEVQTLWSDDGIVLRLGDGDGLPDVTDLVPDPDEVEELLLAHLGGSSLFASQFRENAARSLLLPRRRPGQRMPLWTQRLKAQELLQVAREFPAFPVVMETYRSCLRDVFDVPALVEVLRGVRDGQIRVEQVETTTASPFARSLVFAWVAAWLYEADAPVAERRAQALALDRTLLRELLGEERLRELLDPAAIATVERERQGLADGFRARHADGLADLLRRVGDLTSDELRARADGDAEEWLRGLEAQRRVIRLRVADDERWIAIEDAALYRDGLCCALPAGVPPALLEAAAAPLEQLVLRYARTHGPFLATALARRFALDSARVEPVLRQLATRDLVLAGEFRPAGVGEEWCDPEVLRRIKRLTLARLRNEVAPVEPVVFARFLPVWHGIGESATGVGRLKEVLIQLEGLPLSCDELERVILPARVPDFRPALLDELGATGWLVWVGCGLLGARDGRLALFRRERVAHLLEPLGPMPRETDVHRALLARLRERGASFFTALQTACAAARTEDLLAALFELVWAGLVTNDTLQPLRAHGPLRGSPHQRARAIALAAAGRWSLVEELLVPRPSPTERLHARVVKLLERHGIVSREVAALEDIPGGFSSLYPILQEMEQGGRVRRGYFVEGLGGAQFALPGAVDRLRGQRSASTDEPALVLACADPANPYGWVLPWPEREGQVTQRPRRAPGSQVILVAGAAVLYLGAGGKQLITLPAVDHPGNLERAIVALRGFVRGRRRKVLRVDRIDGVEAVDSPFADALVAGGFSRGYRSLDLEP